MKALLEMLVISTAGPPLNPTFFLLRVNIFLYQYSVSAYLTYTFAE